jgi:hypothetical protein
MGNGKGIVLGLAGLGAVGLLLRAASKSASAPSHVQQTYVDKTIEAAKAKVAAKSSAKVAKAKSYVQKGTAETQAAINAINKLLE